MRLRFLCVQIVAVCLCLAVQAEAATYDSFTRNAFKAASTRYANKTETFDGLSLGRIANSADVRYSLNRGKAVVTDRYLTTTGTNSLGAGRRQYFAPRKKVTFTFSSAMTSFAIDINTFSKDNGAFKAILDNGDVFRSVYQSFPGVNSLGQVITTGQFIGFTTTSPFTSVKIKNMSGRSYTLDTLVYGVEKPLAPVPLPSSMLLLLSVAGLLVALGRARNRAV